MKKIIITESQFKTVIDKFINEATKSLEDPITYSLGRSFPSGQFQITNPTDIDNAIVQFKNYLGGGGIDYEIIITSSESKVPNETVGLKPGQLSEKRAEEVKNYLINKGFSPEIIKIDNKGAQGPEWDRKLGSKWEGYTKFQYVNLTLNAAKRGDDGGSSDVNCLTDLTLNIDYIRSISKVDHTCNSATFLLYANGVPVMNVDKSKSNQIQLNNYVDGGLGPDKFNTFKITRKDATEILKKGEQIKIEIYCAIKDFNKGCHSDPLLVSITNGKGQELFKHKNVTIGERLQYRQGKHIMTLDSCGKVIAAKIETASELSDERYKPIYRENPIFLEPDERGNFKIPEVAEIYKYVDKNTGKFNVPPHLLNTKYRYEHDMKKTWNEWKEQKEFKSKQENELVTYMQQNPQLYEKVKNEFEDSKKYDLT
jgi:hypothetical protein